MKEAKRKVWVVKYKFGTQWFEFHAPTKFRATQFLLDKLEQGQTDFGVVKPKLVK